MPVLPSRAEEVEVVDAGNGRTSRRFHDLKARKSLMAAVPGNTLLRRITEEKKL